MGNISSEARRDGTFVVLDGADGSGTTTQAALICDHYKEKRGRTSVYLTKEPTERPIGALIRQMLRRALPGDGNGAWRPPAEAIAMLFTADRVDHCYSEILTALQHGRLVLCDRFLHSTLVYQSLTSSYPLDDVFTWLLELSRDVLRPDLVIILDIASEEGERRLVARDGTMGAEIFETAELQRNIARFYREMADEGSPYGPHAVGCKVCLVDGMQPVDDVFAECVSLIDMAIAGR